MPLTHIAIIHHGAKLLPNNTIQGGTISHVGQFYIEQNFLGQVEKTSPYNTNKQAITTNAADALFNMGKQGGDDPVLKISLIGSKIEDGLYATIDIGVNPKAKQNPQPVNMWTANGGVAVPNSPWTGYPDTADSGHRRRRRTSLLRNRQFPIAASDRLSKDGHSSTISMVHL